MEMHAANSGFQAKLNMETGSYLISMFAEKVSANLSRKKYLYEIMDDIQTDLADKGKQQIVPVYHNRTRYVTFKRNRQETEQTVVTEQVEEEQPQIEMMVEAANNM